MKVPDIPPWLLFVSVVLGLAVSVLAFLGYLKCLELVLEVAEKPIAAGRQPRHVNLSITQDYATATDSRWYRLSCGVGKSDDR